LEKTAKDEKVELEDQLFFGLIISLAFFVITISLTDVTTLFQAILKVDYTIASNLAQNIKNLLIVCLLSSAILRYYASTKPHKGARLWSFLLLWVALDVFLFELAPMLSFYFEGALRILAYILSYSVLFLAYFFIGKAESTAIKFYAKRGFVLRKYSKPIVSFFFAIMAGCAYITLAIEFVFMGVFQTSLSSLQGFIIWLVVGGLLGLLGYMRFLKRMKLI